VNERRGLHQCRAACKLVGNGGEMLVGDNGNGRESLAKGERALVGESENEKA
jgi:hypothetical protein